MSEGPVERVVWFGGPLDGAVQRSGEFSNWWVGPDPADPMHQVIWYRMEHTENGEARYVFVPDGPPEGEISELPSGPWIR